MRLSFLVAVVGSLLILVPAVPLEAQLHGWKKKFDTAGIGNPLTYNPSNHSTVYGAGLDSGDGSVMVSYDRGGAWQQLSTVAGGGRLKSIIIRPADSLTILVGQEGKATDRVMKSTDGGASWMQTLSGDFGFYGVPLEFNEAHQDTVFTMTGSAILRSTDFGSTWTTVNGGAGINTWCDAALRPDSVDVLYIGDNAGGIWKTVDGGSTLRLVCPTTGEIPMIAIDQRNPATAYATRYGGGGGILRTTDYGETWLPFFQFNGIQCWGVALGLDQPDLILVGAYGSPHSSFLSTDNGNTWSEISCGLSSMLNYGALVLDSTSMFLLQGDGVYAHQRIDLALQPKSFIGGVIEDSVTHAHVEADVTISYTRCDTLMTQAVHTDTAGAFLFDQLFTSDPPVLSDYRLEVHPSLPYGHLSASPILLDTAGITSTYVLRTADVLLAGRDSNGIARFYKAALDSLGITWNYWNTMQKGPAPYAECPALAKNAAIYFTGDDPTAIDSVTLGGMEAAFQTGTGLFLTGQDIAERNDSSHLFEILGVGFAANTSSSYVAGRGGAFLDNLAFFTSGGTGAQNQVSRDVLVSRSSSAVPAMDYIGLSDTSLAALHVEASSGSGRAVVAGFGFEAINAAEERKEMMRRVVGYLDRSILAGAAESASGRLPQGLRLGQNYPNPFNPATVIRYSVVGQDNILSYRISLKVYDMLGRIVATLVDETKFPGEYSATWDATNASSGMYFYRLIAGSYSDVKKMMLLK